jgi:hypothetical protein
VRAGKFKAEIVGVPVKGKKGETVVTVDEEFTKVDFAKARVRYYI